MRKYTALLLLAALSLASCGDDDPAVVVEPLNKLTKISCYEEDNNSLLYSASVSYNVDGSIASSDAYDYQYTGSDLSAIGWTTRWPKENGQGYEERVYPLSVTRFPISSPGKMVTWSVIPVTRRR